MLVHFSLGIERLRYTNIQISSVFCRLFRFDDHYSSSANLDTETPKTKSTLRSELVKQEKATKKDREDGIKAAKIFKESGTVSLVFGFFLFPSFVYIFSGDVYRFGEKALKSSLIKRQHLI